MIDHAATIAILDTLVGFPTVSRDSNLPLIEWLARHLSALGAQVEVQRDATGTKANLFASLGPAGDDGVVLSGHSDVVPVDGQAWSHDPFRLTTRDDRLHARGAVDMKGFIAAMVTAAERAARRPLARPLHLMVSHDEEIGCVGIRPLLQSLSTRGFKAMGCVIGEPTSMTVATGHKGKLAGCLCCFGRPAHSANPYLGQNAIHLASAMVSEAIALQKRLENDGARDSAYPVPHTTVHVGTIKGGAALNIVPERCDIEFEIRPVAPDDAEALAHALAAAGARHAAAMGDGAWVTLKIVNAYPGLDTDPDAAIVSLARAASGRNDMTKLAFGAEAGLATSLAGLPTVVCGPGSIDVAHKADEYVALEQLAACDLFLDRIVDSLAD